MCQLDGTGPGLDLVIVSGCEPFRLRLSDFIVYYGNLLNEWNGRGV